MRKHIQNINLAILAAASLMAADAAFAAGPNIVETETGIVVEYNGTPEPAAGNAVAPGAAARKDAFPQATQGAPEPERNTTEAAGSAAKGAPDGTGQALGTTSTETRDLAGGKGQARQPDTQGSQGNQGNQVTRPAPSTRQERMQEIKSLKLQRMMSPP